MFSFEVNSIILNIKDKIMLAIIIGLLVYLAVISTKTMRTVIDIKKNLK